MWPGQPCTLLSGACQHGLWVSLPTLPLPGHSVLQTGREASSVHVLLFSAQRRCPLVPPSGSGHRHLPRTRGCLEGQEAPALSWPTQAADGLLWTLLARLRPLQQAGPLFPPTADPTLNVLSAVRGAHLSRRAACGQVSWPTHLLHTRHTNRWELQGPLAREGLGPERLRSASQLSVQGPAPPGARPVPPRGAAWGRYLSPRLRHGLCPRLVFSPCAAHLRYSPSPSALPRPLLCPAPAFPAQR